MTHAKTADLKKAGEEKYKEGDFPGAFFDTLLAYNFADGGNHAAELVGVGGEMTRLANEMLGLGPVKSADEHVLEFVKGYVGGWAG